MKVKHFQIVYNEWVGVNCKQCYYFVFVDCTHMETDNFMVQIKRIDDIHC